MKNDPPKIEVLHGLVAFFDIMGFSEMLESNEPEEINAIIRDVFLNIPGKLNFDRMELETYNLNPSYRIFSDSILVYQKKPLPGMFEDSIAIRFIDYCCQLSADMLSSGLPVRGAISKGKFSILEDKSGNSSFTGKCFVETHKFTEALQLAGCAVVPTLESEFSKDGETLEDSFQEDLLYWQAPLKNSSPQKLLMLNFLRHVTKPAGEISRTTLIEKFSAHGKGFDLEVLKKVSETEKFLAECKKRIKPD